MSFTSLLAVGRNNTDLDVTSGCSGKAINLRIMKTLNLNEMGSIHRLLEAAILSSVSAATLD
jgi:hypothetical protein